MTQEIAGGAANWRATSAERGTGYVRYAAFGEGPSEAADQWLDMTIHGQPLWRRVEYLLGLGERLAVNARNLQLPVDFLFGTPKKLKLVLMGDIIVYLAEEAELSHNGIRRNKPRIDRNNQGRTFQVSNHCGRWSSGSIITEYTIRQDNPAPAPHPGQDPFTAMEDYYDELIERLVRLRTIFPLS